MRVSGDNGQFDLTLHPYNTYTFQVNATNYIANERRIAVNDSSDTIHVVIAIDPIDLNPVVPRHIKALIISLVVFIVFVTGSSFYYMRKRQQNYG